MLDLLAAIRKSANVFTKETEQRLLELVVGCRDVCRPTTRPDLTFEDPERIVAHVIDFPTAEDAAKMQKSLFSISRDRLLSDDGVPSGELACGPRWFYEVDVATGNPRLPGRTAFVNSPRLSIPCDGRAHADQRTFRDSQSVTHCRIDAEEARLLDCAVSRQDDMRCEEDMIGDRAVMADVISAPKNDVVSDRHKGLNCVVFENETIVADRRAWKARGARADVGNQPIAHLLESFVHTLPRAVHCVMRKRGKSGEFAGRISIGQIVEGNDWESFEGRFGRHELSIDGEGNHFVKTVVL
jgi:hypothetical protein